MICMIYHILIRTTHSYHIYSTYTACILRTRLAFGLRNCVIGDSFQLTYVGIALEIRMYVPSVLDLAANGSHPFHFLSETSSFRILPRTEIPASDFRRNELVFTTKITATCNNIKHHRKTVLLMLYSF